jgi:predicted acyltransferase
MSSAANHRDQSLDSFRGIDVLLMILVNVQGNDKAAFAMLKHADWNGLTLADLVFPLFLLIVGLSAPLALDKPGNIIDWSAIFKRTALLFLIGVILSWLIHPTLDLAKIRWMGVLQRIAIVYFICICVIVIRRGATVALALTAVLLALHSWMILKVGTPSGGAASLEPGMGISGWLDQTFIPGKVLRKTWEPEGILSTLPAIANGLIGVAVMRLVKRFALGWPIIGMIGVLLLVSGFACTYFVPLNKNLWTASFALVTCGIGIIIWAALKAVWPSIYSNIIAKWTVTLGQAALTLYVVHTLLIALIVRKLPSGVKIWESSYQILASTGLPPAIASLLYAVCAAVLSCAALPWLKRRGWMIKV